MEEEMQGIACESSDERPLVDILMATYNGARFLGEQVDSIFGQSYSHWRLLVNDDGSSDGTVEIVKTYAEKDDRIHLLSLENKRHDAAGNFLALLGASSAPYVMFCDQDDVWENDKIELELNAVRLLEREYGIHMPSLVFTDSCIVDEKLQPTGLSFASTMAFDPSAVTLPQLMVDNVAQGCSMMLNRALVQLMVDIPFDTSFLMHDYWAIALAACCGKTKFLPDLTLKYRQHGNNVYGAGHVERTAVSGISHVLKSPQILKGWMRKLSSDEKKFQRRSKVLLSACGDEMTPEVGCIIADLSEFGAYGPLRKHFLTKKYSLLRTQRTKYVRACQKLGLLLPWQ